MHFFVNAEFFKCEKLGVESAVLLYGFVKGNVDVILAAACKLCGKYSAAESFYAEIVKLKRLSCV